MINIAFHFIWKVWCERGFVLKIARKYFDEVFLGMWPHKFFCPKIFIKNRADGWKVDKLRFWRYQPHYPRMWLNQGCPVKNFSTNFIRKKAPFMVLTITTVSEIFVFLHQQHRSFFAVWKLKTGLEFPY